MSTLPGPNWVYYAAAISLALIGMVLLWRAIFRSYDRRKPICPKCRYDLSGLVQISPVGQLPPVTCPECGVLTHNLRVFARRPRRLLRFGAALFFLAAAIGLLAVPVKRYGLWNIVPLSAQFRLHSFLGWDISDSLDEQLVQAMTSGRLSDAQSTAFMASFPGLTKTRRAWPRTMPLHLAYQNGRFPLPAAASFSINDLGASERKRLTKDGNTPRVPVGLVWPDQTKWVVVPLVIEAGQTRRVLPPMALPIRWVGRMDEAITPVRGETADRVARAVCRVRLATDKKGRVLGLRPTPVDKETASLVPSDTTFAVRVELIHHREVMATTRWHTRAREVWEEDRFAPFPYGDDFHTLARDLSILAKSGAFFRFTTDDEMALNDFEAGHYWRGSIDIPVEEIFGKPVK